MSSLFNGLAQLVNKEQSFKQTNAYQLLLYCSSYGAVERMGVFGMCEV